MLFLFLNAFKSLKKNISINILIVLSLFIGFFLFYLALGFAQSFLNDIYDFGLKNINNSLSYEITSSSYTKDYTFKESIKNVQKNIGILKFQTNVKNHTLRSNFYYTDYINNKNTYFTAIDKNFDAFFTFKILKGRFFLPSDFSDETLVCIIEESQNILEDIDIDDHISIGKYKFKVIGIIKKMSIAQKIYIPDYIIKNDDYFNEFINNYDLKIELYDLSRMDGVDITEIFPNTIFHYEIKTARQDFDSAINGAQNKIIVVILTSAIALFYSLINTLNIFMNKLHEEKRECGTMLLVGSTNFQIVLYFIFKCFVLIFASNMLIYLSEPLINILVKEKISHASGIWVILGMTVVSVMSSVIIGIVMFINLKKSSINDLLKGV